MLPKYLILVSCIFFHACACEIGENLSCSMEVSFEGNSIGCNDAVDMRTAKDPPTIIFNDAISDGDYILLMIDPDAPTKTEGAYWRHWLVGNIKGSDLRAAAEIEGTAITDYNGPTPPKGGYHRYQFLLLQQPENLDISALKEDMKDAPRGNFVLSEFLEKYGLCGGPTGTFQFRTKRNK